MKDYPLAYWWTMVESYGPSILDPSLVHLMCALICTKKSSMVLSPGPEA